MTKTTKKAAPKKAAKKAVAKKAAPKKAVAKKAVAKKAVAKKAVAKKAVAKKAAPKKAVAKKAVAAVAKKPVAKKAVAKKAAPKKPVAKKAAPKKAAPKKAAPKKPVALPIDMPTGEMLSMEAEFPVPPEAIFEAWVDAAKHGEMIGASAEGDAKVGAKFRIYDGYITGEHLALVPHGHIVQTWRTTDFAESDPDSHLEIILLPHRVQGAPGTRLLLLHAGLPVGGAAKYASGWAQFYFTPMTAHFGG